MGREAELVDRRDFLCRKTACDQNRGVPRETLCTARYRDDALARWTLLFPWPGPAAPARGGSKTTASKGSQVPARQRALRNRSRASAVERLAGRTSRAPPASMASTASAALSIGANARMRGKPQRESADAAKEIGDALCALRRLEHMRARSLSSPAVRRLQKTAGRQRNTAAPTCDDSGLRRSATSAPVIRQPREIMRLRRPRSARLVSCPRARRRRAGRHPCRRASPSMARSSGLPLARQALGDAPGPPAAPPASRARARDRRRFRRSHASAPAMKPTRARPSGHARVKSDAAAARAMRVDERRDFGRDAGVAQRRLDEAALPFGIGWRRQRLHGAAAAMRVMRTDRRDAILRGLEDLDQPRLIAFDLGGDGFAGERIGDEDARVADRARRPRRDGRAARSTSFSRVLIRFRASRANEKFAIAVAAFDRRSDNALDAPAERFHVSARRRAQTSSCTISSRTTPFFTAARPASNCGLISATSVASGAASASTFGRQRASEMKLASHTISAGGSASCARVKRARVLPLQRGDARIAPQSRMQLAMADIDGDDMARAARQQHVGEAARRGADVEAKDARTDRRRKHRAHGRASRRRARPRDRAPTRRSARLRAIGVGGLCDERARRRATSPASIASRALARLSKSPRSCERRIGALGRHHSPVCNSVPARRALFSSMPKDERRRARTDTTSMAKPCASRSQRMTWSMQHGAQALEHIGRRQRSRRSAAASRAASTTG